MEKPNERRPSTKIQWHPAFCAAAELELRFNKDDLEFKREYNLSKKTIANGSSDHRKKERRADSK